MNLHRPLSFRARLTLRWTAAFSCMLAIASAAIFSGIASTFYADLDKHLLTLAGTEVTSAIDRPESPPHVHELPVTAFEGGAFTQKFVQIFDDADRLFAAAPESARTMPLVDADAMAAARGGAAPVVTRTIGGTPIRVVLLRTSAEGRPYTVAVGVDITNLVASLARVRWILVAAWLASTLATAAIGSALASTALNPVRRITRRAIEIASSDLRERLEPPAVQDEIGLMTQALNGLIARLQGALDANRLFAAGAAHELRTPLTAMAGEIEVALRRERSAGEYREALQLVQGELASLSSLTTDLILLVRAQEGTTTFQPAPLELQPLLERSVARCRKLADSRGVSIHCTATPGLIVYGESGLLGRVFDNVLENAIRYNRDHGRVEIAAGIVPPQPEAWLPEVVRVAVTDTGGGIPASHHEKVFERFHRLDQSRTRHTGGAGLGLAIAREVLALFKGSIRVAASSEQGTTIAMDLPGGHAQAL